MDDDNDSDRSSEATQNFEILTRNTHHNNAVNDDDDEEEEEDSGAVNGHQFNDYNNDEEDDDVTYGLDSLPMEVEEDYDRSFGTDETETLASSAGLADVPIHYEVREDELEHLKNQLQGSHQEALVIVMAQAAQAHTGNKIQLPPSSAPIPSLPRNNLQGEILLVEGGSGNVPVAAGDHKKTSDPKTVSTLCTVKTPIDGFNWRKYGQKQVKSPQGSRSYYKCTHNECDAKKLESSDQYNSVTKIVYKGQHKHEPPKKVFTKRGKNSSASSRTQERKTISTHGSKQYKSSGSVTNGPILVEEMDAPPPKRRVKKTSAPSPGTVLKPPKKPKFVIHAASDVGISADGYRWRKYGQKMVKGNPHPRNYYKCTSTGCPVRKHIEMAVDGSSEVILTYKGIHDHDMPIRTKEQGSPNVLLLNAVSSPSKNNSKSKKGEFEPSNSLDDV